MLGKDLDIMFLYVLVNIVPTLYSVERRIM